MASHRIRCFFDVDVEGVPLGRVIFELFNDVCPKTCENFRALCTGEAGEGSTTQKPLHYKGVKFHRVIKDFMIQAGDFSAGNGTGGESIYGGHFEDETFELKHDAPFLLSMANRGKDTNGSQFFITTQPASHLDGKHVAFGRVLTGKEVIIAIEDLPVDNRSRPLQPAIISNCGELILQRAGKTKLKEKKKKKKETEKKLDDERKKKKKKKEKEKLRSIELYDDDEEEEEADDEVGENNVNGTDTTAKLYIPHPLASTSTINPDEIPEVPKNRFLDRGYQNQELTEYSEGGEGRRFRTQTRSRFYTKSGRKVKGRGSLRYRTPSRSRSRSVTPPHWRQAQRRTMTLEKFERVSEREQEREKELDERRKRREERHRLTAREFEGERNRNHRKMLYENNDRSGPFRERMREEKTDGDWRVARTRTQKGSMSDDLLSVMKQRNSDKPDLRNVINFSSANKENTDRKKIKDDLDLDDNALDYEAPSEEEEEGEMNDSLDSNDVQDDAKPRNVPKGQDGRKLEQSRDRRSRQHSQERGKDSGRRQGRDRRDHQRSRRRRSRESSRERRRHSRDRHSKRDHSRERRKRSRRSLSRSKSPDRPKRRDRHSRSPASWKKDRNSSPKRANRSSSRDSHNS